MVFFLCLGRAHRAVPLLQMYRWIWDTSRSAFPVIFIQFRVARQHRSLVFQLWNGKKKSCSLSVAQSLANSKSSHADVSIFVHPKVKHLEKAFGKPPEQI